LCISKYKDTILSVGGETFVDITLV